VTRKTGIWLAVLNIVAAGSPRYELGDVQKRKITFEGKSLAIRRQRYPAAALGQRAKHVANTVEGPNAIKIRLFVDRAPDEVTLTAEENVLTLEGKKAEKEEKTFLHRGISTRNFKRQFTLADHVEVRGARFDNGLLLVELQREIPEAMKPRRIAINGAAPGKVTQIEAKAA
jgi:hypothetical protein